MYYLINKKVQSIIYLNCRDEDKEENLEKIQITLRKLKPFKNYSAEEPIAIEKLEKLLELFSRKYGVILSTIQITYPKLEEETVYFHGTIMDSEHKWLHNISGAGTYEVLAKSCIFSYVYLKETGII